MSTYAIEVTREAAGHAAARALHWQALAAATWDRYGSTWETADFYGRARQAARDWARIDSAYRRALEADR